MHAASVPRDAAITEPDAGIGALSADPSAPCVLPSCCSNELAGGGALLVPTCGAGDGDEVFHFLWRRLLGQIMPATLLPFVQVETTSDWDGMRLLWKLGDAMMLMLKVHAVPGFGGGGVYVVCRSGASEGNNARGVQSAMHMLMLALGLFRR